MKLKQRLFGIGISLALAGVPVLAHHPFSPEFDWKKPVTLTGNVKKVEWTNPHASVSLDVRGAGGTITNWALELGSPRVLEKYYGWNGTLLKPGEQISVDGWLAQNGRKLVSVKSVTLSGGRELFAASGFFDLPGRSATHFADLPGKCISDETCIGEAVD
jgi:hypothetical protein